MNKKILIGLIIAIGIIIAIYVLITNVSPQNAQNRLLPGRDTNTTQFSAEYEGV